MFLKLLDMTTGQLEALAREAGMPIADSEDAADDKSDVLRSCLIDAFDLNRFLERSAA